MRRHVNRSDCLSYLQLSIGPKVPGAFVEAEVTFDGKAVQKVTIVRGQALLNRSVEISVRSWGLSGIEGDGPFRAKAEVRNFSGGRVGHRENPRLVDGIAIVIEAFSVPSFLR